MTNYQCHYESLKVTRDAPLEVIRAAYRSLSQKHHPDKNISDQVEAERVMARLNAAYSVLSDAEQRRLYDLQLQERGEEPGGPAGAGATAAQGMAFWLQRLRTFSKRRDARIAITVLGAFALLTVLLVWSMWKDHQSMQMFEKANIYRPPVVTAPEPAVVAAAPAAEPEAADKGAKAKKSKEESASARSAKVETAPAAPAAQTKAPSAPAAAPKVSDYERLAAMLKSMGLGLHKLEERAKEAAAKRTDLPAKPAKPAEADKPAVAARNAAASREQAPRQVAAVEASKAREDNERPAAPEPVRSEAKPQPEAVKASAAAAVAAVAASAPRQPVLVDVRACAPSYPVSAFRLGESGTVRLALLVGNDGKVVEAKISKSSGSADLDKAARKALSKCIFKVVDKQAEPMWTSVEYVFALD